MAQSGEMFRKTTEVKGAGALIITKRHDISGDSKAPFKQLKGSEFGIDDDRGIVCVSFP